MIYKPTLETSLHEGRRRGGLMALTFGCGSAVEIVQLAGMAAASVVGDAICRIGERPSLAIRTAFGERARSRRSGQHLVI